MEYSGNISSIRIDLLHKKACQEVVDCTIRTFGRLDILVNNIGVQYPQEKLTDITEEQLEHTLAAVQGNGTIPGTESPCPKGLYPRRLTWFRSLTNTW